MVAVVTETERGGNRIATPAPALEGHGSVVRGRVEHSADMRAQHIPMDKHAKMAATSANVLTANGSAAESSAQAVNTTE